MTGYHFLLLQSIAFWPVWRWYAQRMLDGSDEPWGIFALATALAIVAYQGIPRTLSVRAMGVATSLALVYVMGYAVLPPLVRAAPAVLALSVTLAASGGRTQQPGIAGLLLLSLPLIASLQFFGGFPIRAVTAWISSHILGLFGIDVRPQGTLLYWLGEVIAVDAPCAGIKMLWTALYLNFALAAWRELGFFATWLSTSFTLFCVFVGNVLRATLLFFTESGLVVDAPEGTHSAIGLALFAPVAAAVYLFHQRDKRWHLCAA